MGSEFEYWCFNIGDFGQHFEAPVSFSRAGVFWRLFGSTLILWMYIRIDL